jgi:hypothetical protein
MAPDGKNFFGVEEESINEFLKTDGVKNISTAFAIT